MSVPNRRPRIQFLGVLAALGLLAACGSSSESASGTTTSTTAAGTDGAALPEGAEDLVGKWAHFDVVAYEDELMNTLIISTGFSNLELRDGVLWNVQEFCHADMGNNQGIEITMPDAATRAIIPVETPVEVTLEDGKLRVVRPATPTGIGIELEDPANDVLPTDPDDPRIFDHDGDGKPGVTAYIKVTEDIQGELYIARREIFHYDVTQETPGRMVGSITDDSEQLIVGASDEIFNVQTGWVQHPDPERNPVIWQRVDDDWDCDDLAAERDAMFPANPEADF